MQRSRACKLSRMDSQPSRPADRQRYLARLSRTEMDFTMRCLRFTCALLTAIAASACLTHDPAVIATADDKSPDPVQQRVYKLETQVQELRQLVKVLQAERLRDVLPVKQTAIIGEWVATTDNHQTITLIFRPNGTCEISAHGKSIGSTHGTGTWKLNEMQVVCSYKYDGTHSLNTNLPLDLVSPDAMAFAGVVYRRSASRRHPKTCLRG